MLKESKCFNTTKSFVGILQQNLNMFENGISEALYISLILNFLIKCPVIYFQLEANSII